MCSVAVKEELQEEKKRRRRKKEDQRTIDNYHDTHSC